VLPVTRPGSGWIVTVVLYSIQELSGRGGGKASRMVEWTSGGPLGRYFDGSKVTGCAPGTQASTIASSLGLNVSSACPRGERTVGIEAAHAFQLPAGSLGPVGRHNPPERMISANPTPEAM
jgi:hypothetical protein